MNQAYLGLGANLGDRLANLSKALKKLERYGIEILGVSSVYETEPILPGQEAVEQPWYLNIAASIETNLRPLSLLRVCQQIEKELGRERNELNAPRPIDIDILFFKGVSLQSEELTIPHPRVLERRFTLAPLAELDPETFAEPLAKLQGQTVRRSGTIPER